MTKTKIKTPIIDALVNRAPSKTSSTTFDLARAATSLTAADLLKLSAVEAAALIDKAGFGSAGRAVRVKIKRAMLAADPHQKHALFSKFEAAIVAFPSEPIA